MDRKIKKWSHKCHHEGAGPLSTTTTDDNIKRIRAMVLSDRRPTIDEVANCLQISHGSAYEIIHNRLGFHKVCARWIPKQLTMLHKQTRLDNRQQNLERYEKGDAFLDRTITGDETWVHHYEPECKRLSMEWEHPQSPIRKNVRRQPTAITLYCQYIVCCNHIVLPVHSVLQSHCIASA